MDYTSSTMAQVAEPDLTGSWNPESTRPRGVLARALAARRAGNLRLAERALASIDDDVECLLLRAEVLFELDRGSDALLAWRSAARLAPSSQRIAGILVHFLWKMGREEEALEELERYIDLRG